MKHVQVREYLRGLIGSGLSVGEAIPSERALCQRFEVSRMTVRQAVDALVVEGLLERVQGKGTFVSAAKVDFQLRLTSFGEEMRARGMMPGTRMLSSGQVPALPDVAMGLGISDGAPVHEIRRVRLADGVPMAIETSYVSAELVPGFCSPVPPDSIYEALRSRGMGPNWGEDLVEGMLITGDNATVMQVPEGSAGLQITRRTFSDEQSVLFSRSLYRADRYTLWVPIAGPRKRLYPPVAQEEGSGS